VEFADKRIAKRVALALNGQRMGGRRRSAYYDDLWCIKYLKHFKWDHLTSEIAYQKAVRAVVIRFSGVAPPQPACVFVCCR
jgi:ESF2/ABP1 family protein